MDQQLIDSMFKLIRYEIGTKEAFMNDEQVYISKNLEPLYKLSKAHDMAHIVADSLYKNGLLQNDEVSKKFFKQQVLAIRRYEHINYEIAKISETFEQAKIPFIPLKGSVIRQYYPEPWMRTSCDIDILVHEEDLDRAVEVLKDHLLYRAKGHRDYHDVSLYSPSGVHLELHFSIKENIESLDILLSKIWDYSNLIEGSKYQYRQTNEYLLFHLIAHMSYHFVSGGCGIRPFLDLFLVQQKLSFDVMKVQEFLSSCALQKFYDCAAELSKVWFDQEKYGAVTSKMQAYILQGGVYGSLEERVAAKQGKKGGTLQYAWSRIFLSTKVLANYYPCIKKHTWLSPFCQIHRWIRILGDSTRFQRSINELKFNHSVSEEKVNQVKQLLDEVGL